MLKGKRQMKDEFNGIRENVEETNIYNAGFLIDQAISAQLKAEVSKALKGTYKRAWDSGYRCGHDDGIKEAVTRSTTDRYEEGQNDLLKALRVIGKKSPEIIFDVIMNSTIGQIVHRANRYLDIEKKQVKPNCVEVIVRCCNCKWNSGTPEQPYCQLQSKRRNPYDFCSNGENR